MEREPKLNIQSNNVGNNSLVPLQAMPTYQPLQHHNHPVPLHHHHPNPQPMNIYPVANSQIPVNRESNINLYERNPINKTYQETYKVKEPVIPKSGYKEPTVEKNIDVEKLMEDPKLKQVIEKLEKHIVKQMMSRENIDNQLNGQLQKNIKEELKHRIMVEMKRDIEKKMAEYVTTTLAAKLPDEDDSDRKHDLGSIYQDTVPPFYNPGIVLP